MVFHFLSILRSFWGILWHAQVIHQKYNLSKDLHCLDGDSWLQSILCQHHILFILSETARSQWSWSFICTIHLKHLKFSVSFKDVLARTTLGKWSSISRGSGVLFPLRCWIDLTTKYENGEGANNLIWYPWCALIELFPGGCDRCSSSRSRLPLLIEL